MTRNDRRRRNYAAGAAGATRIRDPWEQHEDKAILSPERPTDRELAARLGRTVQAIQIRRTRLGGAPPRKES